MRTPHEIQLDIGKELSGSSPSSAKLALLCDELADSSENKVRFSVDASHINRLGVDLVSKRETALSELIKNSFDADASRVDITLEKFDQPGGTMIISDDGTGMSRDIIRSAWMTLSTRSKQEETESPLFGRPRAGKKGIGRFAAQRLGKKLVLETHTKNSIEGFRVVFNWDRDYRDGQKLSTIWSTIEQFKSDKDASGTNLTIEGLRDGWTDTSIRRVWRSILLLQPPFPLSGTDIQKPPSGKQSDPGFQVKINGSSKDGNSLIVSLENDLLQYALAEITGEIDDSGTATFKLDSKIMEETDSMKFSEQFLLTGPVKFQARYFIFGRKSVPGISTRLARQLGNEFGGIRIHRNSFRVSPYGESNDDWLGLDRDVARRAILPAANNVNFFGHVDINSEENILLEETSSREGLTENEAFEELRRFVREGVEWAVLRIASIRGRKQKSTQSDFFSEKSASETVQDALADLDDTVEDIDADISSDESRESIKSALGLFRTNVISAVQATEKHFEQERERNIQYESMLRVLASLGLSVGVFGHEIKSTTNSLNGMMSVLKLRVEKIEDEALRENIEIATNNLQNVMARVFDLGGYIEEITSYTGTRKMTPVPIRSAVDRFIEQFSSYLDRYSVQFDSREIEPKGIRTCEMHSSEFDSILFNFLTNSMKAFRRESTKNPRIKISAKREKGFVILRFEDNGHEIDETHRDKIFDAFFTTTEYSPDDIAGPGTGLGLKIVSDITESYGGRVELAAPSDGYVTCFRILLRANASA